ncbi:alcohol dehydrogenase [Sphingosinicella humi]|uniref:alcohol dehydrogenase n=2 Tax=Allosphingosinicella humi TaxID=2068657 RepID=A0A2U2J6H6_9SPHN|nr:alcohol dehydrogenase [Sphingosinicella humi]
MQAMQLDAPRKALRLVERPVPEPRPNDLLIEISACGVCRTDLHIVDGDIRSQLPIVPGHEIVGRVLAAGDAATGFSIGERVGVPWLGGTCGACLYCREDRENLCDRPTFTGFSRDGGFASHAIADARFCFAIPAAYDDVEAAPLLCAGLIGYRSLVAAGEARRVGLYGFGAAAHILTQVARWQGREVFAFTRPGDDEGQRFALDLGCVWAGGSDERPPAPLDAAIIFAPVGALVPLALKAVRKGGRIVCAGIHMSDIPAFPYSDLWEERSIRSVANLTRADGRDFFRIAAEAPIRVSTEAFPLGQANEALARLRAGKIEGAAVLTPGG